MATVTVDQAKLVMNAFAATFQNQLVTSDIVTWRQYDNEMDDRNGLRVVEQVGPRYAITQTTNGVADLTSGVQDSVFGSEQFVVNRTFGASMGWGDFVKIRDVGEARQSEAVRNAATNLAETIDAYVMGVAVKSSNNWVGTPGQDIDDFDEFMTAYTRLKEEGVDDSDLRGVLTFTDKQLLGDQIANLPGPDAEAVRAFRVGFRGDLGGVATFFTQQLPTLTVGTRTASGAALVNGASQNVNYSAVAVSGNPGQYMSQTINIDTLTIGHTVRDGEVFTIAGVEAYDNRVGASLGRLQQFRVIGDYTADGAGEINGMRIFPAIIVPGSGSGGDINVNTAHATVTAAPADNAAITWVGTASTAYRLRALIQREAVIVNTAPLILPATGQSLRKALTRVPLTVRMWMDSAFATGEHRVRFDVALTANVRDRRRVCRVNGV